MSVSILNTDAQLTGKTVVDAESAQTVTGLKSFSRSTNAPFAVNSGAAVVTNLDADKLDGLEATGFVKADGTVSMSGALNLGATGQLVFPATQNASAGANTLDDYEEGTWTPALTGAGGGSGQAYSTRGGTYTKIGNRVFFEGHIILSTLGNITGQATISGLPFPNALGVSVGCSIAFWSAMTSSLVFMSGTVNISASTIALWGATGGATSLSGLGQGDFSDTTNLYFTGHYSA